MAYIALAVAVLALLVGSSLVAFLSGYKYGHEKGYEEGFTDATGEFWDACGSELDP